MLVVVGQIIKMLLLNLGGMKMVCTYDFNDLTQQARTKVLDKMMQASHLDTIRVVSQRTKHNDITVFVLNINQICMNGCYNGYHHSGLSP